MNNDLTIEDNELIFLIFRALSHRVRRPSQRGYYDPISRELTAPTKYVTLLPSRNITNIYVRPDLFRLVLHSVDKVPVQYCTVRKIMARG